MLTYPKCNDCNHSKSKHGIQLIKQYVGWHKRRKTVERSCCFDCNKFLIYGPTYDWEFDINPNTVRLSHEYRSDNLRYLEHQYEKAAKLSKTA